MKDDIIAAVIWIACGLYAYGTSMAELSWDCRHRWPDVCSGPRDELGMSAFIGAAGPFGAVAIAAVTNFNQHGWSLWDVDKAHP